MRSKERGPGEQVSGTLHIRVKELSLKDDAPWRRRPLTDDKNQLKVLGLMFVEYTPEITGGISKAGRPDSPQED